MRRRAPIQQAFDEARYGPARTLNVRDDLPTGAEAVRRAEGWLRGKQAEHAGEVLIITGRGNGSPGQIPVVREEVRKLLGRLRRVGVVAGVGEHTPGSFAVQLAPLRALFEAPARNRMSTAPPRAAANSPSSLAGLEPETRQRLRQLALCSLQSLGMASPADMYVVAEMEREFALLARGTAGEPLTDAWLRGVIDHALQEWEDAEP